VNTHTIVQNANIPLTKYMQRREFILATGTSFGRLDRCIKCGDVALHLIDGRIKIDALEALRALAVRYPWHSQFEQLAEELDIQFQQTNNDFA
jgi:hypothetical protein